MLAAAVIVAVSLALLLGAAWGIFGRLPKRVEGFVVAMAGGALIVSLVLELVEPAMRETAAFAAFASLLAGAGVFALLDFLVEQRWGSGSGGGLLAAITLDGVPENLALGVALIGATPLQVAALSGSIFLSNLPEAAGGAKQMSAGGRSNARVFALWGATAALLSGAGLIGYHFLADAGEQVLALIRCFAAGAVVASLPTEVFPTAYRDDRYWTGIATAVGLVAALYLDRLGR